MTSILRYIALLSVAIFCLNTGAQTSEPDYLNDPDPDGLDYEDMFADEDGKYFDLSFDAFIPPEGYRDEISLRMLQNDLIDFSQQFLGCRYVHGGKGPKVFDCSGYTSYIFGHFGISLSPASRIQGEQGYSVPIDAARPGDLIFFSPRRGGPNVGHVGMIISVDEDNNTLQFIHASVKKGITIQSFPDDGYYSKRYLFIKRVL